MRAIITLALAGFLTGCGPTSDLPATEPASASVSSRAMTELELLDDASLNHKPPFDKLPDVPVAGFCPPSLSNEEVAFCDSNRLQMMQAWPKAWAGDYQAQRNVAYMQSQKTLGIPQNRVQGCAWRIVLLVSGHVEFDASDTANYNLECGKLSEDEYLAAKQSAASIVKKIGNKDLPSVPAPERGL